jgi:hypothetical protein
MSTQVWIFTFAGSSHPNYKDYLIEFYCLLKYESSKELKDAVLDNMLVNLTGELSSYIEADLLQEHYNKWLEAMVTMRNGNFDDSFYRETISPNVNHFLRIKEIIQEGFNLAQRSKTHTSPHLQDEFKLLLAMYKELELHSFRSGRSLGHIAKNRLNSGYTALDEGGMDTFLRTSLATADITKEVLRRKSVAPVSDNSMAVDVGITSSISNNSTGMGSSDGEKADSEGSEEVENNESGGDLEEGRIDPESDEDDDESDEEQDPDDLEGISMWNHSLGEF